MKHARILIAAAAVLVGVLVVGLAVIFGGQAGSTLDAVRIPTGAQGCPAEYWADNPESWEEYDPAAAKTAPVFGSSGLPADDTFMDAIRYVGGDDLDGARRTLLRAAVTAALNAAHESIRYPLQRYGAPPTGGLVPSVRQLLAGTNADAMLQSAAWLDSVNDLDCPLQ